MSLEIKRPKGVTVFLIIGILDAIIMMSLFPIYYISPEIYSTNFDNDMGTIPEFAILKFSDYFLEWNSLTTALAIMVVIGLLSSKKLGWKIVIGSAIAFLFCHLAVFSVPGLILHSVLVWYMFRPRTKEYFEIKA